MRKIVYYVASSLDGFIAGPNEDISGFVRTGNGVDRYLADLSNFDTVIMGRHTYEFGYNFGLRPGQPAYPHMHHYIFSDTLKFENSHLYCKVLNAQTANSGLLLCWVARYNRPRAEVRTKMTCVPQ